MNKILFLLVPLLGFGWMAAQERAAVGVITDDGFKFGSWQSAASSDRDARVKEICAAVSEKYAVEIARRMALKTDPNVSEVFCDPLGVPYEYFSKIDHQYHRLPDLGDDYESAVGSYAVAIGFVRK